MKFYNKMILLSLLYLIKIVSSQTIFPQGRCYVHQCSASPYNIEWISTNCFQIVNQTCTDLSKYTCCPILEDLLHKIVFPVNPACKAALVNFTINGLVKPGGITFDVFTPTDAELRISSMTYNISNAIGLTMCLNLQEPCPTLNSYITNNQMAFFDTYQHNCCPTCNWNNPFIAPFPPALISSPVPPSSIPLPPSPPVPIFASPSPPVPPSSIPSPPSVAIFASPSPPVPIFASPSPPVPIFTSPLPPVPIFASPPPANTCGQDSDPTSCKTLASLGFCDTIKTICPDSCGCTCICTC